MSDTSPKNQDALLAGYMPPTPTPRQGAEEVWRVTRDGRIISCEWWDESKLGAGWDVARNPPGRQTLILAALCG